jgi:Fe-S-cluster containining protein
VRLSLFNPIFLPSSAKSNKIKVMECLRCGKCCFEPFYRHVRPDDLEHWKEKGRRDLITAYQEELGRRDRSNPEMAKLGMPFHTCMFLKPDGKDRFACQIYEVRPITCQKFDVGCSRLCPQYQGKKRRPGK